ncbi:MAG: hypothetical protein R6X12_00040 [bacterium]
MSREARPMVALLFILGGQGLAAQAVVMRELMAAYAGSEFTAAVVLGTWLGLEALGARLAGGFRATGRPGAMTAAGIAVAVLSALAVPAATLTRPLFGLLAGEQPGPAAVAGAAALVSALPALLHGWLFVEFCGRHADTAGAGGVGQGYAWEGFGAAAGGLVVAAALVAAAPGLAVVAGFGAALLAAGAAAGGMRRLPAVVTAVALVAAALTARASERLAWQAAWPGFRVEEVADSPFGKTVTLTREAERVVVSDGVAVAALPPADRLGVEQAAVVPALLAAEQQSVLVLGGAGFVPPLLELPAAELTLVAQDRLLLERIVGAGADWPSAGKGRVRVVHDDPRRFLARAAEERFDCIIGPSPVPLSLSASRLATVEFFRLCRRRLRTGGVVAVPLDWLTAGAGRSAARLYQSSRVTMAEAFDTVAVLPLDLPVLVAGAGPLAGAPDAGARLAGWHRDGAAGGLVLDSAGLTRLLDRFRGERLERELAAAAGPGWCGDRTSCLSTDAHPRGLFLAVAHRAREAGLSGPDPGDLLRRASSPALAATLVILLVAILLASRRGEAGRRTLAVATSGFAGSALVTVAMFAFQAATGALYAGVVLLLACFMSGTVLGGRLGAAAVSRAARGGAPDSTPRGRGTPDETRRHQDTDSDSTPRHEDRRRWGPNPRTTLCAFVVCPACVTSWFDLRRGFLAAEVALVAAALVVVPAGRIPPGWVQFPLLTLAGCALGYQFPVAASAPGGMAVRRRIGRLAAADLAGGLAGILAVPMLAVPVAGLGWACGVVAGLKLASLLVQLAPARD